MGRTLLLPTFAVLVPALLHGCGGRPPSDPPSDPPPKPSAEAVPPGPADQVPTPEAVAEEPSPAYDLPLHIVIDDIGEIPQRILGPSPPIEESEP